MVLYVLEFQKYHFPWLIFVLLQYGEVVNAIKKGDLRLLRQALREHEDRCVSYLFFRKNSW